MGSFEENIKKNRQAVEALKKGEKMTEQELREKIDRILHQYIIRNLDESVLIEDKYISDQILAIIEEAGYVKLAEDQNLPIIPRGSYSNADYLRGQSDMLKAGWRKVEFSP